MDRSLAPRLTDSQLVELLGLLKGSDTVELKLTVPAAHRRSILRALKIDPLDAEIRQVVFFDTPDLKLNQHGVVVRARRIQGGNDDSVVKLRPVQPEEVSPRYRKLRDFGIEVDAMPGGFVCSGSMKGKPGADPKAVLAGDVPIRRLFTKDQRAFYAEYAPEGLALDHLSILGPITVLKTRIVPEGFNRKLVAEMWFYPDGSTILELSTKCPPAEMFHTAAEARAFFAGIGIDLSGEQATKTKTALEFFVKELPANQVAEDAPESAAAPATVAPAESAEPPPEPAVAPEPEPEPAADPEPEPVADEAAPEAEEAAAEAELPA